MKKIVCIFSLVLFTAVFTQAQVVQSSKTTQSSSQSISNSGAETFYLSGCAIPTSAKPSLSSEDLVIEKNVKISKVSGAGYGFWIEKNGVKIKEFATNSEAMGYVLSPGTYTAYPMLPKQTQQKAKRICVNIELQ
jgi:hypothetical protein